MEAGHLLLPDRHSRLELVDPKRHGILRAALFTAVVTLWDAKQLPAHQRRTPVR
jgi:hypothetical protein